MDPMDEGNSEEQERLVTWQRNAQNKFLREAVVLEPDLLKVFKLARRSKRVRGYDRIRRYYDLKDLIALLVGYEGQRIELRTTQHFDAVMVAMESLLPEDLADNPNLQVAPGEDEVEPILATRPQPSTMPGRSPIITAEELMDPNSEVNQRLEAQAEAERVWLRALTLSPDPVIEVF